MYVCVKLDKKETRERGEEEEEEAMLSKQKGVG